MQEKDVHTSPVRAPKWKLAVEPSSTGGHCNPPKTDTPCAKTKKKLQWDGRRGTIRIKSNPIPTGGWPTNWRTIIPKNFSHCYEGSEPHVRLPSLGIQQRTGNPFVQGIWSWRPVGFGHKTSTGLGETETPVLEGTSKVLHVPRPRGKEQWPHRRRNQNYLLVLEGLLWRHGLAGAHHRNGGTDSSCLGRSPLA